jgi:hypothetical protein
MAEIGLQRLGIDALVGERVAAGIPEHVRWTLKPILASSPDMTDTPMTEVPYAATRRHMPKIRKSQSG